MRIAQWSIFCRFLLFLSIASGTVAQEGQSALSLTPEQQNSVAALAQDLQKELRKEKCSDATCGVLIINLALRSGETCSACILLSDSLAKALGEVSGSPNIVSRQNFASFMDKEILPAQYLSQQKALVWIGHELRAKKVIFGTLDPQGDSLSLSMQILGYETFDNIHASKEVRARLPMGGLGTGLAPRQFFSPPAPTERSRIPSAGIAGVTLPRCFYMPNPSYTDPARQAKISGKILVEGIITTEGRVTDPQIIRGLPYGLNESALGFLKTWRCSPATLDGKPVTVRVPFEVTFQLH